MIITRINSGFGNQLYEYINALWLSKISKHRLVFDISDARRGGAGYLLDETNIPDIKKIFYEIKEPNIAGTWYVHEKILEKYTVLIPIWAVDTDTIKYNKYNIKVEYINSYKDLADIARKEKYIYMMCWWNTLPDINKILYKEFQNELSLRRESKFIEALKNEINVNRGNAVGIHIRRGDFLDFGFSSKYEEDRYYAMIQFLMKKIGNCSFYIFTNDYDWAQEKFGLSDKIRYISSIGGIEADIDDFYCLSYCQNKIVNNQSTYSGMADFLCQSTEGSTVGWSYNDKFERYMEEKNALKKIEIVAEDYLIKIKSKIQNRKHFLRRKEYISIKDIIWYSKLYKQNKKINPVTKIDRKEISEILSETVTEKNAFTVIDKITDFGLNFRVLEENERMLLLRKKAEAFFQMGNYEMTWMLIHKIRMFYQDNDVMWMLLSCEENLNLANEWNVDYSFCKKYPEKYTFLKKIDSTICKVKISYDFDLIEICNFIIRINSEYNPQNTLNGLIVVGIILKRLGHHVCFVFNEFHSLQKDDCNNVFEDAYGTNYGCEYIFIDQVIKDHNTIQRFFEDGKCNVLIDEQGIIYNIMRDYNKFIYIDQGISDDKIRKIDNRYQYKNMYTFEDYYYNYVKNIIKNLR